MSEQPTQTFQAIPDLPPEDDSDRVVFAAVVGCATALALVITGLTLLGYQGGASRDVAITGLASIGSALAGGFAGWIARGRRLA